MSKNKKLHKMPYEQRRQYAGLAFMSPWLIGVSVFFLYPFLSAIYLTFCDITFSDKGMVATFSGLSNIKTVYLSQTYPIQCIIIAAGDAILNLVLVTMLSLFIAVLLNQNFKGRGIARTVFAIPVIVASGTLMALFKVDYSASSMMEEASTIFNGTGMEQILMSFGLSSETIESFVSLINTALDLIWRCGVQILLFLSGMQSIPSYLNEVSDIDGATAWQKFWKITFPLITPMLMINAVYTLVESSTYYDNPVMKEVGWKFNDLKFGYCNAMGMGYCIVVLVIIAVVYKLIAKRTVYLD